MNKKSFIKNKFISIFLIIGIFIIIFAIYFTRNNNNLESKSKNGFFLGTVVNIKIWGKTVDDTFFDEIFSKIQTIENKMSINIDTSEITKINNNATNYVPVSDETFNVISKGLYYSQLSDGYFDISIGPLVKIWGIGSEDAKVPTKDEIDNAKKNVNYKEISINKDDKSVKLNSKNMIIDLGGIAKGYTADIIADKIKEKGYKSAIINLGGNIYCIGNKPDSTNWKIGIQNPFQSRGQSVGVLQVQNKSIVTSGIYERFFIKDNKRYHHILNPFTGYPVENELVSVSIISDKSIDGDGLSTTAFSLGLEKALKLINNLNNVDAIFITNNKKVYITKGIKNKFKITNNEFTYQN